MGKGFIALLGLALACGEGEPATTTGAPEDSGMGDRVDGGRPDAATDAGDTFDARVDEGGPPPAGSVPMFVAVGYGGRRVATCDFGRTWIADQSAAPESEDDWHRSYTPKGLAYGDGRFVFLSGWGTTSTAWVSEDGMTWVERPLGESYGAVGYDGDRFVLVGNRNIAASADGFMTSEVLPDPAASFDRAGGAYPGLWAAGADGNVETLLPGGAWTAVTSCTGPRHGAIGQSGGFGFGLGRLVSLGTNGDTCVVDARTGEDLGAGSLGAATEGRPTFVGDAFWVPAGATIYASTDGLSWTARPLTGGVSLDVIARADTGQYVGLRGGDGFFYSDDGETWSAGEGPAGNGLLYLAFGYATPSSRCPAP